MHTVGLVTVLKQQELAIILIPQQQGCDLSHVVVLLPPYFAVVVK
jgi:hypothetical protein